MELIRKRFIIKKTEVLFSPVQLTPSPEYPGLQVHTKDPLVFLQLAFAWQLCFPASHSFISAKEKSGTEWLKLISFFFQSNHCMWSTIIAISCDEFSFQNEVNRQTFSFEINFHIKRLRTLPRYKTEARDNSKMAYYWITMHLIY